MKEMDWWPWLCLYAERSHYNTLTSYNLLANLDGSVCGKLRIMLFCLNTRRAGTYLGVKQKYLILPVSIYG